MPQKPVPKTNSGYEYEVMRIYNPVVIYKTCPKSETWIDRWKKIRKRIVCIIYIFLMYLP